MVKFSKDNSNITFHLDAVMKKRNYSKSRLCKEANLRFETVQGYYNGTISRIDLYVLSQLCKTLKCNIEDIIKYNAK
ncbi:MAG: helix-turn-helix domain-containing protein [Bacilli bacterium]